MMRQKKQKKRSGFTLIELMVSMAVLGIVSSVTMVSLSGSKARTEVENAARQVAATIREAQNNAVTGRNISGVSTDRPCQFNVSATSGGATLSVQQIKFASGVCNTNSGSAASYPLPTGVTFAADASVRFDVPRGEPKDSADAELTSGSIGFGLSKGGVTARVCVYPLGRIEEKKVGVGC